MGIDVDNSHQGPLVCGLEAVTRISHMEPDAHHTHSEGFHVPYSSSGRYDGAPVL